MQILFYKTLPLVVLTLTACGPSPSSHSSRLDGAPLSFAAQPAQVDDQVSALTELSRRIVVQSTNKGAPLGAATGCGLAVISVGSASNCLAAAAIGGAGGAVVGHVKGKRKVARQVDAVSPSTVVRTLRKTNAQMELVKASLPARLAAQEAALSDLEMQRATGAIDAATYTAARAGIAAERRALAGALIDTENNAKKASANLQAAQRAGQSGLDWHISATSKLSTEASSARSSILLL